jgi:dTDP-4-amino-4,6-dideoxygalactose transaminase
MVVTNDEEIAFRVQMLRNHGGTVRYKHENVGLNSRLDEMQAAILRVKLQHLPAWNASRRSIAHRYSKGLAGLPGIEVPYEDPRSEHVFHLYVIRAEHRDQLQGYLRAKGIPSGIHYPVPIHLQRACDCLGYRDGSLPRTEKAAKQILSLPIFPEMYDEEVDCVIEAVRSFALSRLAEVDSVEAQRAEI